MVPRLNMFSMVGRSRKAKCKVITRRKNPPPSYIDRTSSLLSELCPRGSRVYTLQYILLSTVTTLLRKTSPSFRSRVISFTSTAPVRCRIQTWFVMQMFWNCKFVPCEDFDAKFTTVLLASIDKKNSRIIFIVMFYSTKALNFIRS